MKPLLIFGLRGTLVERIHVRSLPPDMPQPDMTVGLSKVWLRPHLLQTLLALQEHCNLALWSSTTQRNTTPLVEAVFRTPKFFDSLKAGSQSDSAETPPPATSGSDSETSERRRFSKRRATGDEGGRGTTAPAPFESPIHFEFVWSREHASADEFRRRNPVLADDAHATVKDLSLVFQQFPAIACPQNTILIDDTPSKAKLHAGNFLWLDSCEGRKAHDQEGLVNLQHFVMEEVCKTNDVRELLPRRLRGSF